MFNSALRPIRAVQEAVKASLCLGITASYFWGLFHIMGQAVNSVTCTQFITSLTTPIKLPLLPAFTRIDLIPGLKPESILWLCNYTSVGSAILLVALLTGLCLLLLFAIWQWNPQRSFYRARLKHKISRIQELARELAKAIELTDDPDLEDFFNDEEIQRLKRISRLRYLASELWTGELNGLTF